MVLQNTVASSFVIACPEESHDADDLGRRMAKAKTVWHFLNFLENRTIYKWYQKATRNLPETMPCRMPRSAHAAICQGALTTRMMRTTRRTRITVSVFSGAKAAMPRWASGVQQQNRPRRWRRKVSPVNSTTSPQTPVISRQFQVWNLDQWWNMMKPMLKPILFHWHHVSILPIPSIARFALCCPISLSLCTLLRSEEFKKAIC